MADAKKKKTHKDRAYLLKKLGKAVWNKVMGKKQGKLEKALKDGIDSQKKKLKIMKEIEKK